MTNNKQQTTVEWQYIELLRIIFKYATNKITPRDLQEQTKYILEQAKEMEKERMIKFCIDWFISREMNIKEYYEQTYGEGEQ